MIVDARKLPNHTVIQTAVCIVGGGTAGITLARELIGKPFSVCVLESGGQEPDPETQTLCEGDNIGLPYFALDIARVRCFGGSGTRWHVPIGGDRVGARLRPLDALDFERRDWVPHSGWPFDKAHLDPYYERAESVCGVSPKTYDVSAWEDARERPRLALPDGGDVQTIVYKFVARDRFVRELPAQVADGPNVTVYEHATVLEVETNEAADSVTGLRVSTTEGNQFSVQAKFFVLAAGGIEIPRLLLLSNRTQATGLANQHDLVGRFFMEHPHFWSGLFVPKAPDLFRRASLYNDVNTVNGVPVLGKLALTERALKRERLLNQNVQLIFRVVPSWNDPSHPLNALRAIGSGLIRRRRIENLSQEVGKVVGGIKEVAVDGTRRVLDRLGSMPDVPVYVFANMMEQAPNPESRVTLGPDRDLFGQNRAQLNWKITADDVRSAVRTHDVIGGALERAGLGRFYRELEGDQPPPRLEGGYHHMGTTRMHHDPTRGVVNADCRVHGIQNLFIAGPSVFPTGGYANPVLTLVALALRLADHLIGIMG
jgi:choline dehydrogenase-like flavoprotein